MLEKIGVMGIFIICAQAVIHFSPGNSYNKYLKLLLSIMVLVQLLQPVISVLFGGNMELPGGFAGNGQFLLGDGLQWGSEDRIEAIWQQVIEEKAEEYEALWAEQQEGIDVCADIEMSQVSDTVENPISEQVTVCPVVIEIEPIKQEEDET